MMVIEAWAHYFGVAPPNLYITLLSVTYFLFLKKISACTLEIRVIPKKRKFRYPKYWVDRLSRGCYVQTQ